MALSFEETKEIEGLKQEHKKECSEQQQETMKLEHGQKLQRLEKHLELAKLNYKFGGE